MDAILSTLTESSLRAAIVAVAVGCALAAARVKAPWLRRTIWTGVLGLMLAMPLLVVWAPKATLRVLPSEETEMAPAMLVPPETLPIETPISSAAADAWAPPPRAWGWQEYVLLIYLAGLAVLLARLAAGTVQMRRFLRGATPEDGVWRSPSCAVPLTLGLLRPRVLLPAESQAWDAEKLACVLAHEREHVRRRDPLVLWLARLNRCVFWFHPLAWWLDHRLGRLAEEACDEAVLAQGHDSTRYAEVLVELSKTVSGTGARLLAYGPAMNGGTLRARLKRVLHGGAPSPVSRLRMLLVFSLCLAAALVPAACNLGRVQKPAPGQPTMNELTHRRAAENQRYMEKQRALQEAIRKLTPEEARALVTQLKSNPDDEESFHKLIRYYQYKVDVKGLDQLTLWYIEHYPAGKVSPWIIDPRWDRGDYEKGKRLWLAHVHRLGASAEIYQRAARYLEGGDKPLAEKVLFEGQKAYPNDNRWTGLFGTLYAQTLLGSDAPRADYNVIRTVKKELTHSTYAENVRGRLANSNDPRLLTQVAQGLFFWSRNFRKELDFDPLALARTYVDRALSLRPDHQPALTLKAMFESWEISRQAQSMSAEQLAKLTDSEKLRYLPVLMDRASWRDQVEEAVKYGRELLAVAARNRDDPFRADAVYSANITLGKAALRKGDKRAAVRYLLAASETPGSHRLRYGSQDMNLARSLVDWGERDAVATYLERFSRLSARGEQLSDWAVQIRKGINPDLFPTHSGGL